MILKKDLPMSTSNKLKILHFKSGLTKQQLAYLFGVSPNAINLWMAGGHMSPTYEDMLDRLTTLVNGLPAKGAKNRLKLLLTPGSSGYSEFDRLRTRRNYVQGE